MADMMEGLADQYQGEIEAVQNRWNKGWHETKEGKKLKIKEMTTQHLINTINYFKGYDDLDTSPFQRELDRRNKI